MTTTALCQGQGSACFRTVRCFNDRTELRQGKHISISDSVLATACFVDRETKKQSDPEEHTVYSRMCHCEGETKRERDRRREGNKYRKREIERKTEEERNRIREGNRDCERQRPRRVNRLLLMQQGTRHSFDRARHLELAHSGKQTCLIFRGTYISNVS